MPSRAAVGLKDVASLENLSRAFWRAASGKRDRADVQAFGARLDLELTTLRAGILDESVSVGELRSFRIRDPKPRTIHAPCFRERVLHHALIEQIGPVLDRALVADTFACRVGKGTLAAALRAREYARRFPWFVKVDIASFFASIDHASLEEQLARRIKGASVLRLCGRIIDAFETEPGKGLPIGALTSQHFANTYLSGLDRLLLEELRVAGMVRYMDDVVSWHRTRQQAREALRAVEDFARERLALRLHPSCQLQRSRQGLTFCGFRIHPNQLRLTRRRKQRYARSRERWEAAHRLGLVGDAALQAGYAAALGITAHAAAAGWRRRELLLRPAAEV